MKFKTETITVRLQPDERLQLLELGKKLSSQFNTEFTISMTIRWLLKTGTITARVFGA